MQRIISAIIIVLMLVTTVSCGKGGSIKGKWTFGGVIYDFKDDNKVSISVNGLNFDGTYKTDGDKLNLSVSGLLGNVEKELSYSLNGDKLTLTGDITLSNSGSTTAEFTRSK